MYAEREEEAYTRLVTDLLRAKGSGLQREFLAAVKDREEFMLFMSEVPTAAGDGVELFSGPLTEQSFVEMTVAQEGAVFEKWEELPPKIACRVSFWAEVTLRHVESGVISEAYWLAANGGKGESGEERVDRALATDGGDALVDRCVRTVIRRLSGLSTVRGNKSVFVNPTFSRAWWRERLVRRILDRGDGVESGVLLREVVRTNQQYWENLITGIVSRGSVFGSVEIQDAFINGLAKHRREEGETPLRTAKTLGKALRRFSNIAAARELGVLEFDEVGEIVVELLARVQAQEGSR